MSVEAKLDPTVVANRDLRREIHSLGVTGGQVALLVQIGMNPGIGVRELAARERMSPAGMSGHVDRLVEAGLVERTPSLVDRRRVGLTLTAEGQRVRRSVKHRRTAWLAARLRGLSAEELEAIDGAVGPLQELIDE